MTSTKHDIFDILAIVSMIISSVFMLCMFVVFVTAMIRSSDGTAADWVTAVATAIIGGASILLLYQQNKRISNRELAKDCVEFREKLVALNNEVLKTSTALEYEISNNKLPAFEVNSRMWNLLNKAECISGDAELRLPIDLSIFCKEYHQKVHAAWDILSKHHASLLPRLKPDDTDHQGEFYKLIDKLNHLDLVTPFKKHMKV